MSKSMVLAAVVSLAFATAAFAQSNTATTIQVGAFNNSAVSQSGARNAATTAQIGFVNNSYVGQSGYHNAAGVGQAGLVNNSIITQRR